MNRDHAVEILLRLRRALQARGIAHAGIFGSIARGEAGERSDIDIVVAPVEGARLDLIDLGGVQTLLDEGFGGISVDVIVEPVKSPQLSQAIQRDRINAF